MSLFHKFQKGKNQKMQTAKHFDHELLEIVRIVSFDDEEIFESAQNCINHTMEYYQDHTMDYEERGLSSEEEKTFLQWIGCIDLLIGKNYVCECDWKETMDEFVSQVTALRGMKLLSLKINSKWFDEEEDIPKWCEALDEKWKKSKSAAAAFDIDSDSYVIFLCKKADIETLSVLAEKFGYRIDYAKNM